MPETSPFLDNGAERPRLPNNNFMLKSEVTGKTADNGTWIDAKASGRQESEITFKKAVLRLKGREKLREREELKNTLTQ
jgi:hypothetical protein